jgi:hypothetical protein
MRFLGRLLQSKGSTNDGIVTEGAPSMKADQDQPEQLEQATLTPSESNLLGKDFRGFYSERDPYVPLPLHQNPFEVTPLTSLEKQ